MTLVSLVWINLAVTAAAVLLLWVWSCQLRNVSIVDIFWGCGFTLIAWTTLVSGGGYGVRPLVLTFMVTLWGLRLAGYLAWRNWGKPEDYRYAEMRRRHGNRFPLVSLFTVFALQGLLMWVISLPVQIGIASGGQWQAWRLLGVAFWLTGLLFEAVGDWQLAQFKAQPENKGQVMNRGLWRYTRHPNYFGDFLVWWGFYVVAAEPDSWWWTLIGPLLMSFLLIRVSGVRLLEHSLKTRVAGYEDYVRTTSSFVPLPPKKIS